MLQYLANNPALKPTEGRFSFALDQLRDGAPGLPFNLLVSVGEIPIQQIRCQATYARLACTWHTNQDGSWHR
ncbi:hypothetical protein KIM372_08590 [Bombiscardovia nodaiensis]|uniref:Uncharacterized protein n=1 Tax=Bombiscardovia nodaiensis TaxID=2932181 RepID=A0ABM8B8C7_9BIFI|nr:hypothetical protein KIM372_08590 [Bombiscardovia nodaiensis]